MRKQSRLSSQERKELILDLCQAISTLRSPEEAADVLTDLLMPKEIETIAKRLKIADLLIEGNDYRDIRESLKVGYSTIARVQTWLSLSGKGFRMLLSRKKPRPKTPSIEERYDPYSWYNIKKRYAGNFWPQLIVEEIIKSSNEREKKKIEEIVEKLELKRSEFSQSENKRLYKSFSSK